MILKINGDHVFSVVALSTLSVLIKASVFYVRSELDLYIKYIGLNYFFLC